MLSLIAVIWFSCRDLTDGQLGFYKQLKHFYVLSALSNLSPLLFFSHIKFAIKTVAQKTTANCEFKPILKTMIHIFSGQN